MLIIFRLYLYETHGNIFGVQWNVSGVNKLEDIEIRQLTFGCDFNVYSVSISRRHKNSQDLLMMNDKRMCLEHVVYKLLNISISVEQPANGKKE